MTYIYIAALRLRRSEPGVSDAYSRKSLAIYMYVAAMAGAVSDFSEECETVGSVETEGSEKKN